MGFVDILHHGQPKPKRFLLMDGFTFIGLLAITGCLVFLVIAWLTKRDGETLEEAVDRVFDNDAHKEREANKQAGLDG